MYGPLFQRYWNGTRRKVPLAVEAAPAVVSQVITRRTPYRWEDFAPTRIWRNPRRTLPLTPTAPPTTVQEFRRRPPYQWADFAPTQFWTNPRRKLPIVSTAPLTSVVHRRPPWRWRDFALTEHLRNPRRKLPIVSTAPPHAQVITRRPPWAWEDFALTQFWKNPRRKLPITPTKQPPRLSQLIVRRPAWSWHHFAPPPFWKGGTVVIFGSGYQGAYSFRPRLVRRPSPIPYWRYYDRNRGIAELIITGTVSGGVEPPVPPPITEEEESTPHWFLDLEAGGFWPMQFAEALQDPTAICAHAPLGSDDASDVITGARDGIAYQLDRDAFQDNGHAFESYVMIGPVRVGTSDGMVGLVEEIQGCLTDDSGNVTWALRVASNYEDTGSLDTDVVATGLWFGGGLNQLNRPRRRGMAFSLTLSNAETNDGWSVEEVNSVCSERGMRR